MNQWYKFIKEEDWTEFFQLLEESIHDIDYVQFFIGIRTLGETLESTPGELVILYRDIHTYLDNEGEITNKESSPFYYEKIRLCFKIDYEKIRNNDEINLREYQIKQLKWWRVCTDQENSYIQFYFDVSKHDRESEVKAILGIGEDSSVPMDEFYKTEPGNIYGHLSSLWFLKRYDIKSARKIIDELLQAEQKSNFLESISNFILSAYSRLYERNIKRWIDAGSSEKEGIFRLFIRRYFNPCLLSLKLGSVFSTNFYNFVRKHILWCLISCLILLVLLIVEWIIDIPSSFANSEPAIGYNPSYLFRIPVCFVYAYTATKIIEVIHKPVKMRLLIPRLLCSISLGFLVLVVGDEVWEYAATISPWICLSGIITSLIIAYIYLRTEIGNTIGWQDKAKKKIVLWRTVKMWGRGILYSFGIGLILMDVLCGRFLKNINVANLLEKGFTAGLFGVIQWKVGLFFSCIAFLIGIFVQVIWEDKPITHPL